MSEKGDATGVAIPIDPAALEAAGADWLTQAFRAYGAIAPDNAVTRVTRCKQFAAGNSGDKQLLSVEYAQPSPDLHTELFVKFSRCLHDPFRDRRARELEGEVRLAGLSRHPAFPVAVAKPYFADFNHVSGDGVLIAQRILYGEHGLEPLRRKNMDHELADPAEYYRATASALARLAAAHRAGRLSPEADTLFPFDPKAAAAELPLAWTETEARAKAARIAEFIADAPRLFPANVARPEFAARFVADAMRFHRHDAQIRRFLFADRRMIALAHWNTHIDNAWFWRDSRGVLQAGLLDWGMARRMNLAMALWGGLSGGNAAMWERELDALVAHFLAELAAHGGSRLDPELFALHFDLAIGMLTLAVMLDMPAMFLSRLPDVAAAKSPDDPMLHADKVVHGFLHTFGNAMSHWANRDFGASLTRMLAIAGEAA